MKKFCSRLSPNSWFRASLAALLVLLTGESSKAAEKIWDGGGGDNNWRTAGNWDANVPPAENDRLSFTGTTRLINTNNFVTDTIFIGLNFNSPAGAFTLFGNEITLGGDISDSQALVPQTINLPLSLSATRTVNVVLDGSLTINGAISGDLFGLTKTGAGLLTLTSSSNSFSGRLSLQAGTLGVGSDQNLGAAPSAPEPARIVIDGGTLQPTATFSLNANRGIALGPVSGTGAGTFSINAGLTLTYDGIIANNGAGTGGLTKIGFGGLTLSKANAYTGPSVIKNGTLTLDFTKATSPLNDIVSNKSSLTLGGANAGLGAVSFAALTMTGSPAAANSQTFSGTTIDIGAAIIRASGGTATLALGPLGHNPGGAVEILTPTALGSAGKITTTSANVNGILGGWAIVGDGTIAPTASGITVGTDWASVNAAGNIVPYAGYTIYPDNGVLQTLATSASNVRIDATSTTDLIVNTPGANATTDINTLQLAVARPMSIQIGAGNTLRLGKYGGIFKADSVTAGITWALGTSTGGANGIQDEGILTAGGAPNTPGEIVFTMNAQSQTAGSLNVETQVTDNGTGKVTVIKTGPGSMKFRGHNTYSGGTYIIQGRFQLAGSEIASTNPNPGGWGTGPVYVMPGAYAFPSGVGTFSTTGQSISNAFFVAGSGLQAEQVGAIRFGNGARISGDVTLTGDTRLGGGNAGTIADTGISGKVSGPFNLEIGALQTINTFISLLNPSNDWSGNTILNARNTATANSFRNGTNEVIPSGLGKGNVIMNGNTSTGTITWDLNGSTETINGLSAVGFLAGCIIANNTANTVATLNIGDNNQSATFGGIIQDAGGTMSIKKIGNGSETLTGVNTYTGPTVVSGGTLAVSGAGSIASSQNISVNGGTLDVSGLTSPFSTAGPLSVNNGTFTVRATGSPGISSLRLTNATVRLATLTTSASVETANLVTGGATNFIDIVSVGTITSYPTQFTVLKYSGAIGGSGFNFALGNVPSSSTQGYISNNPAGSTIELVLLDGPKPLTWLGNAGSDWDVGAPVNWLAFGAAPIAYGNDDTIILNDRGTTGNINLKPTVLPAALLVTNQTVNYLISGPGAISGFTSLNKDGNGSLTLATSGISDFKGGVTVNNGTLLFATDNAISGGVTINRGAVQVGNGTAAGQLPSGNVVDEGVLLFNRTGSLTVNNPISGSGDIISSGGATVTLSGNNENFLGGILVSAGTLKAGNVQALGPSSGTTTIASGATLDVNGNNVGQGTEQFIVSGSGVGDKGAIINTGADVFPAVNFVTLKGNTTFGGTGRWDLRSPGGTAGDPSTASLSTEGNPYTLTKVGNNFVGLVSLTVDPALTDIDVQAGTLDFEGSITSLGDPSKTLTVRSNAIVSFWSTANALDKNVVIQDTGSFNNGNGDNTFAGPITIQSGAARFNIAGTSLTIANVISGNGGIRKLGNAPLVLASANTFKGDTTITAGRLNPQNPAAMASSANIIIGAGGILDATSLGNSTFTLSSGQTLSGSGAVDGSLVVPAGSTLLPGTGLGTLTVSNSVTLSGTTIVDLDGSQNTNDVLRSGTINFGGTLNLVGIGTFSPGTSFKIFDAGTYTGSFATVTPSIPGPGLNWDTSALSTSGILKIGGTAQANPKIGAVSRSGNNVVVSGTGGVVGATYTVLSSTNIAQPVGTWTPVATNNFGAGGAFTLTIPVDPATQARFFVIRAP